MKPQVAPIATAVKCLRIECTSGLIVRLTRYPVDLTMSNGQVYQSGTGYDFTGYSATTSMSPSAIDLEGFLGFAGVTRDAIASGVFDGARCYLFATNFLNPVEDYEPIVASIMGKTTLEDEKYIAEEMALIDALNQSTGQTYTATCKKTFGGTEFAGCKYPIAGVTVSGTLTAVGSASSVTDSARSELADYFGAGTIKYITGANAGLRPLDIKSFTGGVFTTYEPAYYAPQIGDQYIATPGCRKRLADCRDKWSNVVNFGGFPDIPTESQYGKYGTR